MTRENPRTATPGTTTPPGPANRPLTTDELRLVGGALRYELKNVLVTSYDISSH